MHLTVKLLTAVLLTSALLTVAPACAYLRDRGRDLSKVVEVQAGIATGFNAHGGLSHFVEFGAGWYGGRFWGLREGAIVDLNEERSEFGVPVFYLQEVIQVVNSGSMVGRARVRPLDAGYERFPMQWFTGQLIDRDPLDIHIGGNAAYIGFHFSIRTLALADFLGGFFGVDFRRNDLAGVKTEELLLDLHSPDALERRRAVELLQDLTGKTWHAYQTPTRRDLLPREERHVLNVIEEEVRGGEADPAAVHVPMEGASVSSVMDWMPGPVEVGPSKKK